MSEQTPVIIAARNAEASIGRTLAALNRDSVDPIVVVNDSNDATANIAGETGAIVYEIEQAGKLPAIQHGLRKLGKRALGSILYLDSDSWPVYPRHWAPSMLRGARNMRFASGLYLSHDGSLTERVLMSSIRLGNVAAKFMMRETPRSGVNMITNITTDEALDRVLNLPNYWPGEDGAIAEAVANECERRMIINPRAMVWTSSQHLDSPLKLILHGRKQALEDVYRDRSARGPADAIPYT